MRKKVKEEIMEELKREMFKQKVSLGEDILLLHKRIFELEKDIDEMKKMLKDIWEGKK